MTATLPSGFDRWTIWWNRLSQLAGLGIILYQTVLKTSAETNVLLVAAAMMLGPAGLRLMLKGFSDISKRAADELEQSERREKGSAKHD